jgi:hypothetical protein
VAIALLAGALATVAGASPTGDSTIDRVLTFVIVAGVTWLGAAAMRWDAALITIAAGLMSWSIAGAALGLAAAFFGYTVPVKPVQRGVVNAALIGLALNIAARSHLGLFLGASAIVFVALAAYVSIVGFFRRRRAGRQAVTIVVGTATALAVAGALAVAAMGYLALDDLRDAGAQARRGLDALGDEDIPAARDAFEAATASFAAAEARIDSPITAVARWIPGIAQHREVAVELTASGAESSRLLADELERVDLDALTVRGGRIDVDKVREVKTSLLTIDRQIEALQDTVAELDSPWIAPPLADRIDDLAADLADQRRRSEDALTVAAAAPGLLGGDGPRTYFLGFTTPAEARGSGGFMGNWAEVTATDGQIEVTRFGRTSDLNDAGEPTRRFTSSAGLDEWLARYGPYNINSDPNGTTLPWVWKNINMSPDMAATGRAIADLYPQSGGGHLDGVFLLDIYTLSRLLQFTGPVPLPDGQVIDGRSTVDADTAADFLLNDQYDVTDTPERIDVLEGLSRSVITALLAGTLPPPDDLIDVLGPMVDQGRFAGWAARESEQRLFDQIGLSGTLADPGTGDGVAIAFNNAAGSKIDYYLTADATYTVTADATTNTAGARLEIEFANTAPTDGEPDYVIGNLIGLPVGYNRTWVSVFTKLPVTHIEFNGLPVDTEVGAEAGYFVTSAFVALAPGATGSLTLDMDGRLDVADRYEVTVRTPPTVSPTPVEIDATWIDAAGATRRHTEARRDPGRLTLTVNADD